MYKKLPLIPLADVNVIGSIDKASVVIQEHHALCGLGGDLARSDSVAWRVRAEHDSKAKHKSTWENVL